MATNSATILREARTQAGLSRRALATRAGVATSTVSRIEEGESDPTFMMLRRLVSAAGRDLVVDSQPRDERPTLAELSTALDEHADSLKIDWTRLRGFVDWVEHHPDELADAIAEPPATNARLMKAVLAALAEQLADEHGVERPRWTRTVEHLTEPWVPPATSRMRASFEASAPEPFSRRNVILPRSALFRSKA